MAIAPPDHKVEAGPRPSQIISALNHPIRRSSLRYLLNKGPASAAQIAGRIPYVTKNRVRFHLDILVTSGMATKEKRVAGRESVYSPTEALRARWVGAALKLTAGED